MNRSSVSTLVAFRTRSFSALVALVALFVGVGVAQESGRGKQTTDVQTSAGAARQAVPFPPLKEEMTEGDAASRRNEWFYGQRAKPYGKIPPGVRQRSLELLDQREGARSRAILNGTIRPDGLSTTAWTAIGPQPTNVTSRLYTSTSGRVEAIAIDPRSVNTAYLGSALGGVWKTTDGGVHWTALFDQQKSMSIGAIAIDPSAPDTVYVASGEGGALFGYDTYYGAGIFKSTNAGASWTQIGSTFIGPGLGGGTNNFCGGGYISSIAVQPNNSQVLLATGYTCASNGVYRSTDGGNTWTLVKSGLVYEVKFDASNPSVAYTAFGNWPGVGISGGASGMFKSTDGGATWSALPGTGANLFPATNVGRVSFSIAASSPTTIYAAIGRADTLQAMGVWKTTDGGANWTQAPATGLGDYCTDFSGTTVVSAQCWFDNVISVNPKNANNVYVGGAEHPTDVPLYVSTDGGATFTRATPTTGQGLHADTHAVVFSNDGSVLYTGNDGGVWSTNNPATTSPIWTNLNATLSLTQFYPGIAINPTDVTQTFGGTQDNGTQQYVSGAWSYFACGDGGQNAFDSTAVTIYGSCTGTTSIFKVTSSGGALLNTNAIANDRVNFVPPFTLASDDKTLYFGTYRVWQSPDAGLTWNAISPDLTSGAANNATVISIAVSPVDPKTVWALTNENGFAFARIWVTHNANAGTAATWTNMTPTSGWPGRAATTVIADPANASIAYVTFSGFSFNSSGTQITATKGHVFKTTNAGTNWTDISGDLETLNTPVNTIAVDPTVANTLYAATDIGVFVTHNGGTNWTQLGSGFPRVVVLDLKLHNPSRTLRAATHGRGLWDILVPTSTTGISVTPSPSFLTFLNQSVGTVSATQTVTVTVGGSAVTIGPSVVTAGFQLKSDTCSNTTVQAGGTCSFGVAFAPTAAGVLTGTVTAPLSGAGLTGTGTINLEGNGVVTSGSSVTPETGWWWDSQLNGTGFFIEYRPGGTGGSPNPGIFVGGFIYDNSGNATWIITLPFNGVGTFTPGASGLSYSGNWLRCTNGQTLTGVWKQNSCSVYAPVTINFTSSTTATMTRPDGTTINLSRFSFSSTKTPQTGSPQSGWWWIDPANPAYNPGAGGTGYGIEIQGNAAFIVAYVYDGTTGNPIWNLTTSGSSPMTVPNVYTGTWSLFTGVPHWCTSASPACTPDGNYTTNGGTSVIGVTINFSDATHGTMTMGSTSIPIMKFTNF